jgi:hypothetical protein
MGGVHLYRIRTLARYLDLIHVLNEHMDSHYYVGSETYKTVDNRRVFAVC